MSYLRPVPVLHYGTDQLIETLESVDALNRWARAGGPRDAIYYLKEEAIRECERRGLNTYRLLRVIVKCNRCRDGIYVDWNGDSRGACYHCSGTGKAKLEFVESLIAERFRWHSPRLRFYIVSLAKIDFEKGPWIFPDDWKPNAPGVELAPVDAARHLNVAEPAFGAKLDVSWTWPDFYGKCDHFAYNLPLGKYYDACGLCGTPLPEAKHRYGCSRDRFSWSAAACLECDARFTGTQIFDALPVPAISADPEIVAWKQRHDAWFAEQERQREGRRAFA